MNFGKISEKQSAELSGSVLGKNLSPLDISPVSVTSTLITYDEKKEVTKKSKFTFSEKYQDGYTFVQDDARVVIKPRNIDQKVFKKNIVGALDLPDGTKKTNGQFISYEGGKNEKHIFSLLKEDNVQKQWSLYQEYESDLSEEWEFENAVIKKNNDNSISVYKIPAVKDLRDAEAGVDYDMAKRINATMKKEMGNEYYISPKNFLFTIPKPYFVNAKGENKDAEISIENDNILKIGVKAEKEEFPILLDPTILVKIVGDVANSYFGNSVANAGDMNGDGLNDVIVGAPYAYSGRAFIFYGGGITSGTATTEADVKLTSDTANDWFGEFVSSAGDMNGDGLDDVIVGAPEANNGRAYIFYGGVTSGTASTKASVKLTGDSASDYFGYHVSGAGDMNGDSKDDVIVGAYGDDDGGLDSGSAFIFYGGVTSGTATTKASVKLTGSSIISVSGAGDMNGDGKGDVIAGGGNAAFIFYGGVTSGTAATKADVTLTSDSAGDWLGFTVSDAGDMNDDGLDDVIVGAYGYNNGTQNGAAYIFYGGVTSGTASTKASVKLTGDSAEDWFGYGLSGLGDVNGDGKDDVIVGAYGDDDGGSESGSAFIFYGGVTSGAATAKADAKLIGDSAGDRFGVSVSGAVGANGDFGGNDDIIVGAYLDDDSGSDSGSIKIYTSDSITTNAPTSVSQLTATANGTINNSGSTVTTRGFKYGLTQADTWDVHEDGSFSTGAYSLPLTGLTINTPYYIRAYATNSYATGYGSYFLFRTAKDISPVEFRKNVELRKNIEIK